MTFDSDGRIPLTPKMLFDRLCNDEQGLIDHCLISATPAAFTHVNFCKFLHAVSVRLGVHSRNLILRGSCQIGFSISPKVDKVWMSMDDKSDLDLAIVDAEYYERIEQVVTAWEERTQAHRGRGLAAQRYEDRLRDRFFNCCRVDDLPRHLVGHHSEAMAEVAALRLSGPERPLKAFIFRDWWSLRERYCYDLRQLRKFVEAQELPEPGDTPLPRIR